MVEKGKKQFSDSTLTAYAVSTRYPGDFEPIDEQEYRETLETAEKVNNWVKKIIDVEIYPKNPK